MFDRPNAAPTITCEGYFQPYTLLKTLPFGPHDMDVCGLLFVATTYDIQPHSMMPTGGSVVVTCQNVVCWLGTPNLTATKHKQSRQRSSQGTPGILQRAEIGNEWLPRV